MGHEHIHDENTNETYHTKEEAPRWLRSCNSLVPHVIWICQYDGLPNPSVKRIPTSKTGRIRQSVLRSHPRNRMMVGTGQSLEIIMSVEFLPLGSWEPWPPRPELMPKHAVDEPYWVLETAGAPSFHGGWICIGIKLSRVAGIRRMSPVERPMCHTFMITCTRNSSGGVGTTAELIGLTFGSRRPKGTSTSSSINAKRHSSDTAADVAVPLPCGPALSTSAHIRAIASRRYGLYRWSPVRS